jgi:hypothetical protein
MRVWFMMAYSALLATSPAAEPARTPFAMTGPDAGKRARVVIAQDLGAIDAFHVRADRVHELLSRGLLKLTGKTNTTAAWLSLVSTQDTVGLKVVSTPGSLSGTRPAVAAAVVEGLLAAGLPPRHILVWDKHRADLESAGFGEFEQRYGIRMAGSAEAGYDEKSFYETALLGNLIWGDFEFGKKQEGVGRKSFVSKLVTQDMTKIILITPLLNHYQAEVAGNLYSLAIGSVDNTARFENNPTRLAEALPEIVALPALGDRVVLNIVDALICQYEGEHSSLLHYSTLLGQLRFSLDPVALDVLSAHELEQQRKKSNLRPVPHNTELYRNASLLELGASEERQIQVELAP